MFISNIYIYICVCVCAESFLKTSSAIGIQGTLRGSVADEAVCPSHRSLGCWIKGRSSSVGLNQELQQSLPVHLGCGMVSNGAYIPSELNPADDPTRQQAVRPPSKALPSWILDLLEGSCEGLSPNWTSFDAWLDSYGFSAQSLSGLPSFEELKAPWVEKPWSRASRHKCFLQHIAAVSQHEVWLFQLPTAQSGIRAQDGCQSVGQNAVVDSVVEQL